ADASESYAGGSQARLVAHAKRILSSSDALQMPTATERPRQRITKLTQLRGLAQHAVNMRWDVALSDQPLPPPSQHKHDRTGRRALHGGRDASSVDMRHSQIGNDHLERRSSSVCREEGIDASLSTVRG